MADIIQIKNRCGSVDLVFVKEEFVSPDPMHIRIDHTCTYTIGYETVKGGCSHPNIYALKKVNVCLEIFSDLHLYSKQFRDFRDDVNARLRREFKTEIIVMMLEEHGLDKGWKFRDADGKTWCANGYDVEKPPHALASKFYRGAYGYRGIWFSDVGKKRFVNVVRQAVFEHYPRDVNAIDILTTKAMMYCSGLRFSPSYFEYLIASRQRYEWVYPLDKMGFLGLFFSDKAQYTCDVTSDDWVLLHSSNKFPLGNFPRLRWTGGRITYVREISEVLQIRGMRNFYSFTRLSDINGGIERKSSDSVFETVTVPHRVCACGGFDYEGARNGTFNDECMNCILFQRKVQCFVCGVSRNLERRSDKGTYCVSVECPCVDLFGRPQQVIEFRRQELDTQKSEYNYIGATSEDGLIMVPFWQIHSEKNLVEAHVWRDSREGVTEYSHSDGVYCNWFRCKPLYGEYLHGAIFIREKRDARYYCQWAANGRHRCVYHQLQARGETARRKKGRQLREQRRAYKKVVTEIKTTLEAIPYGPLYYEALEHFNSNAQ